MPTPHRKWRGLGDKEKRAAVVQALQSLAQGKRGVSISRFNGQKPAWMPGAGPCGKLFGGWPETNVAAGLTPLRPPGADRGKGRLNDEQMKTEMGPIRLRAGREVGRGPLVVKCSDAGQPYRYYDPIFRVYRVTIRHKGGRFDEAG